MKNSKRFFAFILTVIMLIPLFYIPVSAEEFGTPDEVAVYVKEQMLECKDKFSFSIKVKQEDFEKFENAQLFLKDLLSKIEEKVFAHTGKSNEGDYLHNNYSGEETTMMCSFSNGEYSCNITYNVTYKTTKMQESYVGAKISDILSNLNLKGLSDYEKIKKIRNYICDNVAYDFEHKTDDNYDLCHTAYAALHDGKAVCDGYASLFYRLCLEAGIDCRIITGKADTEGGPEDHAWNIVKLNNLYFFADITWDDVTHRSNIFLYGKNGKHAHHENSRNITAGYKIADCDYYDGTAFYPDGCKEKFPDTPDVPDDKEDKIIEDTEKEDVGKTGDKSVIPGILTEDKEERGSKQEDKPESKEDTKKENIGIPGEKTVISGNLNEDVVINVDDARCALRIAVKLDTPTDEQKIAGDVTGDGEITVDDARLILRVAVKLENESVFSQTKK